MKTVDTERADGRKDGIYWCTDCEVPFSGDVCGCCGNNGTYLSVDLRPVFAEERELLERITGLTFPQNSTFYRSLNRIIANGRTLFRLKLEYNETKEGSFKPTLTTNPHYDVLKERLLNSLWDEEADENTTWKRTVEANRTYLDGRMEEAREFITRTRSDYSALPAFVSFSGGKDSVTVALLEKIALPRESIPLFFADTTLEADETYRFLEDFCRLYNFDLVDYEKYRSPKDFFELCEELGSPSIFYRWCCTVFKSYPVNVLYKDYDTDILTFDGIRRKESLNRRKYKKISRIKKIPKQIAAYPIIDWKEFDVWMFILSGGLGEFDDPILFNPLYKTGQTRVGCVVCPAASPTNCFFRRLSRNSAWEKFETLLYRYAETAGRDRKWVDTDYWRLRRPKQDKLKAGKCEQGYVGNGETDPVSKPLCGDLGAFTYLFGSDGESRNESLGLFVRDADLSDSSRIRVDCGVLEFLKPFGRIRTFNVGKRKYFRVVADDETVIASGMLGGKKMLVQTGNNGSLPDKREVDLQLLKAMNCVGCGGCVGSCPFGAIELLDGRFHIDSQRCIQCRECVGSRSSHRGCIALSFGLRRKVFG